jgi:hypothetical protein
LVAEESEVVVGLGLCTVNVFIAEVAAPAGVPLLTAVAFIV